MHTETQLPFTICSKYTTMALKIQLLQVAIIFVCCFHPKIVSGKNVSLSCTDFDETSSSKFCTVSHLVVGYGDVVNFNCCSDSYRRRIYALNFTESKLPTIPHGLFRYFMEIKEINISLASIEDIYSDFDGANNLEKLTMAYNNVTQLRPQLFTGAPNIQSIDLSHNQIERINPLAFVDVTNLSLLFLSYNRLRQLDGQVFEKLVKLQFIDLENNELDHIDETLFARNPLLRMILLNKNRLTTVDCQVFATNSNLLFLYLSHNQLVDFDASCIRESSKLKLVISGNQLKNVTLECVKWLDASNNRISTLTITDEHCPIETLIVANSSLDNIVSLFDRFISLKYLDVSMNRIGRLNISTFAKMENLEELYLRQTQLQHINHGTFDNQKKLEVMDVSLNGLNHIDFDIFYPCHNSLKELYIDGNNLKDIEGLNLRMFPHLKILGLASNHFNCFDLVKFKLLNFNAVVLTTDTVETQQDATHVNGIACVSDESEQIEQQTAGSQHSYVYAYVIATIAGICLIFIIIKFLLIYLRHRNIGGPFGGCVFHLNSSADTERPNLL